MALKNTQINCILREYDKKQQENRRRLRERQDEIYQILPAVQEIEQELAANAVEATKLTLAGDDTAIQVLKEKNQSLIEAKTALLASHGYDPDYLQLSYFCPDCKDTGYITNHVWQDEDHILLSTNKCHCFKQAVVDLLYSQSGIRSVLDHENFSTFCYDYFSQDYIDQNLGISSYENVVRAVATCQDFIQNFDKQFENILFYGNAGVGKTFLSNCIAKELLNSSHTVIYLTAFQFFDILERHKFNKNETDYSIEEKFQGIMDCDLLIIDDLGTELTNSFINSQLYLCVNERLLSKHSTIISTNLSLDEIRDLYSERIFSRITSNYTIIKLFGEDIRLKKAFAP
ncbi:MAG: ATP-binding protein [Lachnospiraceae bacterium]|nr:ATP-binding protein [Lachnospiraceae bacterium]